EDLKNTPRNKTILITTGTQGEPMSALSLLAHEKHKWLMIDAGDTVIISASVIPGNERGVSKIINNLLQAGAHVIYEKFEDIHVSGHGYREELKTMLSLTRPKFFLPVHGEFRNLVAHAKLAKEQGVQENRIQVMQNGDILELTNNSLKKKGFIDCQQVFVDGKGVGDVGSKVIQDRQALSEDGIVVVIVSMHGENGQMVYKPEIISRGFVYIKEASEMIDKAQKIILKVTNEYHKESELDFATFKNKIKSALRNFFYSETKRKPMIVVRIIEK
ncbi:MAG: ribonuclease J, partial [Spirochaetota bacterium]|nr:ribonuclease J [Spirochaetota bacterium]